VAPTLSRHVPGFSVLLDKLEDYGVRTVIVEDASRFARDVQAHILGIALLRARGVRLLATNGDKLTDDTDEMTEGMLTIAAVFSQIVAIRGLPPSAYGRPRRLTIPTYCNPTSTALGSPSSATLKRGTRHSGP
jgi:hypothetical protein